MRTTGVYSHADLEANWQGYQFFNKLDTWKEGDVFDICAYVNGNWSEEKLASEYSAAMAALVKKNTSKDATVFKDRDKR